jgi:plasmid stabilization system protein ParE
MTYRVIVQRLAAHDLQTAHRWSAQRAPHAADLWLDRFQQAIRALGRNPERCRLARENGKVDAEVREFLFGRSPHVFRVIFTIDGDYVRVLRIRRGQRRFLTQAELEEALDLGEDKPAEPPN